MKKSSFMNNRLAGQCLACVCLVWITAMAQTPTWILQPRLSDEFNYPAGTSLDTNKWYFQVEAHNNGEAQQYTNAQYNVPVGSHLTDYNFRTTDTSIQIVARAMKSGNYNYTSGRLNAQCRMPFMYGKTEFRMKPPGATISGLWPAVWMLGNTVGEAPKCPSAGAVQGWPNCGEVDIWEYQSSHATSYLTNGFCNSGCTNTGRVDLNTGNEANVWRVYYCEWNSTQMKYWYRNNADPADTVRGLVTKSLSGCSCFKQDMFYLINLAVGGSLGTPISCAFPETLELDYIRTYKLSTDPQATMSYQPEENRAPAAAAVPVFGFLSRQSKFQYVNHAAGLTRITVTDLNGRLKQVLFDGSLSEGTHFFTWDTRLSGPGVFLVSIRNGVKTTRCKVACY
jgi:beta-glucanase (GH16 family)